MVELESGVVEADVNAIVAQEQAAYRARYGKLTPALYERLQQVQEDELLPIAVWMAPDPAARSQEAIFAELVRQFPGAAEALARYGVPWRVDDATVGEEIRQAYFRALSDDALRRLRPLAEQLKGQGSEVTTLEPVPSLFARLSKSAILALQAREDIDRIYLLEMKPEPALVEAVGTDRMPQTWYQGTLSGAGRRIAVLEPDNIQNTGCLNVVASRPGVRPPGYDPDHKTRVASVLACNNATYRGIAYNASLIDAGYNGNQANPDMADAVSWAIQTPGADAVNASFQTDSTQTMGWDDRVLDYWVRLRYGPAVVVVAAGNNTVNVTSPGKGWNVITVGAIDDQNNSGWGDDAVAGFSNYTNPSSTHNDHEKPDLVAPGTNITMIGPGGNPIVPPPSGTSYAAPQVAGLAALLMNRNGGLVDRPEAVKAVLMASAAHNIQDSRVMPSGQDLRDGAGSIDAALALQTAEIGYGANNSTSCNRPCWWATDLVQIPPGNMITRHFRATRGERIRVAVAWFSQVDPWYWTDSLQYNLNLQVMAPSGGQVTDGYSASWDNSNELVEFVAPETGLYTIRVIRSANDTANVLNEVAIAWSKQATYLPDVRGSNSGWTSSITVRNEGAEPRPVRLTYFLTDGTFAASQDYPGQLQPNAVWTVQPPWWLHGGSAVVDGSQDLSVVVETEGSAGGVSYANNYTGLAPDALDLGWGQVGQRLFVPLVKGNDTNSKTTRLAMLNTGAGSTQVTVSLTPLGGGNGCSGSAMLTAQARWTPTPAELGCGDGRYAARITSSAYPLAVVAVEEGAGGAIHKQQNVFAQDGVEGVLTANRIYVPQAKNNAAQNAFTALAAQNIKDDVAISAWARYYDVNGGFICSDGPVNLAPAQSSVFTVEGCLQQHPGFIGSACVASDGSCSGANPSHKLPSISTIPTAARRRAIPMPLPSTAPWGPSTWAMRFR